MDIFEETTPEVSMTNQKEGFIQHVFNFDTNTKSELLNIIQYASLAIIPIIVMNKVIKNYIPEADYKKDTLEIVIEIFGQLILLLGGIFFIHRIITYIPTYSGIAYQQINFINMILVFLVIILSLQTKLGEKVEILFNRVMDLWNGRTSDNEYDNEEIKRGRQIYPDIKDYKQQRGDQMNQQIPRNNTPLPPTVPTQEKKPDMNYNRMTEQQPQIEQTQYQQRENTQSGIPQQPEVNFDQMYQEPMAANDALGGGFGSLF